MPRPSSIGIEIHTPASCVVTLYGEHDAAGRDGVTLALALARDYTYLLVDLTPCTFLDGTVINALLATATRMRAGGASLELAMSRTQTIRRTLEFSGVLELLPLHETRSAGIAAISAAERLAAHPRPVSLRAARAEIDHFHDRTEKARARTSAATRSVTVVRAQVADSQIEEETRDQRGRAA